MIVLIILLITNDNIDSSTIISMSIVVQIVSKYSRSPEVDAASRAKPSL